MKNFSEIMYEQSKKSLSNKPVTTMSYDLDTSMDNNINQEIKDILIEKGWNFIIPEIRIVRYYASERNGNKVETPNTTAWKVGLTPSEGCKEFRQVLDIYNTHHIDDNQKRFGRGMAFCVYGNEYDAIKVE